MAGERPQQAECWCFWGNQAQPLATLHLAGLWAEQEELWSFCSFRSPRSGVTRHSSLHSSLSSQCSKPKPCLGTFRLPPCRCSGTSPHTPPVKMSGLCLVTLPGGCPRPKSHFCIFFGPMLSSDSPLQTGLVPFHVRSLVQLSTDTLCDSMMWPGTHWYVTVLLYLKSLPSRRPLAGIPGSPQFMTRIGRHSTVHCQATPLFPSFH